MAKLCAWRSAASRVKRTRAVHGAAPHVAIFP